MYKRAKLIITKVDVHVFNTVLHKIINFVALLFIKSISA